MRTRYDVADAPREKLRWKCWRLLLIFREGGRERERVIIIADNLFVTKSADEGQLEHKAHVKHIKASNIYQPSKYV